MRYEVWVEANDSEQAAVVACMSAAGITDAQGRFANRAAAPVYDHVYKTPAYDVWRALRDCFLAKGLSAKAYFG